MNGGALYRRVHRTIMPLILSDHKLLVRPSVCLFARELMARLTGGVGVGWSIKFQLVRPRLFDHWFDLDQSYQTGRSLVENCSQSPPVPGKDFVKDM